MTTALVQKLSGVRDLKKILETTVKDIAETFGADSCQIMLSNPLNPNVTSICEHKAHPEETEGVNSLSMPLVLHGRTFGSLSISRAAQASQDEVNSIRVILGELGDIIHYAQINDIVQRDTFRETFLIEIGNVMAYSLGIGDALFMVVNILGKVLQVSRCLFICTDDTHAGWKCYEYWQQDKVGSCHDYCWPTTDSPLIAQTLLSRTPLKVSEGQLNSYVSPVQEELQFIGCKSLLGVALRTAEAVHGCVILQQCDYRRAWTRNEIDMVQNVADKVAESLVKLPAEKRAREPIMQLHQRIVAPGRPDELRQSKKIESVRRALKGALGQQAIPTAAKTSVKEPPSKVQAEKSKPFLEPTTSEPQSSLSSADTGTILGQVETSQISPATRDVRAELNQLSQAAPISREAETKAQLEQSVDWVGQPEPVSASPEDGSYTVVPDMVSARQPVISEQDLDTDRELAGFSPQPTSNNPWGDLDSIPSPSAGPAKGGLIGVMLAKVKGPSPVVSPLMASFYKDKSKHLASKTERAEPEFVAGPPLEMDEAKAQDKLNEILSSSSPSSDYIFATPGLDARMLGRIDGWVSQIEQKDKYLNGHARQVAEYATAIAFELGLSQPEIDIIRQASLVHDVGKLGSAPQILQKPDEELSDPELITVMKHPLDGAELLESFPDLKLLAPIVRAHHEEYDGNGYPQGLKGEEIPLAARIIHVANSYHAMVSPLRYGAGMSPAEAQEELVKGKGSQWDPEVVQALLQCLISQKVPPVI